MTDVRTNPYWRFAGKIQKLGQSCVFNVKKIHFFRKKNLQRQILETGGSSAKITLLTTFWALQELSVDKFLSRSDEN